MLGNHNLTPVEFARCKDILQESGALKHAQTTAEQHVNDAIASLEKQKAYWDQTGTNFLKGLAQYLLVRTR
jgi:geranylgeranyl pyrophosphate synthase